MASKHPYAHARPTSFWSRAVSTNWNAHDLFRATSALIAASDVVVSAGSCFAANIVPYLEQAGFHYLKCEDDPLGDVAEDRYGYSRYSAAYGNVYTARQLLQLLRRSLGRFKPREDRWHQDGAVIDPFRPGLAFPAESDQEFDLLTSEHLNKTRIAFESCNVFIFTLGLTESWESTLDGAVYPICPGVIAGSFDPDRHAFRNASVGEIVADLDAFVRELGQINPAARLILTVSPVPLVATATDQHVFAANAYSKAALRAAADEISRRCSNVVYFPAYEIVVGAEGLQYFEEDRRNVTRRGIEAVMEVLLASCSHPQRSRAVPEGSPDQARELSKALAEAECEEIMLDPDRQSQS